ncbi:DegT/DnrJ/EryC1/StrS family aminotransferase [Prochlorococcus sp. AH-716-B04]|nr:DegT/DnrJ/EryC1/StrS family aminotransferase [Prochlorococcus sp. AH-716-B04]
MVNFIDLEAQQKQILPSGITLREDINKRISEVLDRGAYILGPEVEELESALADFVGVKFCITMASGTDAILAALMSLDVEAGDEVITTPFSFFATSEMITLLGAIPVFVDIDPLTYNLDPTLIEQAITKKTKAIMPVSLYGQPANFLEINLIAKKFSIPVIEDAAQSFGAMHHGKKSCNLSDIGTTSFFPSKPFGCYGDGGACFTDNPVLAENMRKISRHGQSRRYFHTEIGFNGRLDTLQAAVLLAKLPLFKIEIDLRQKVADTYFKLLKDLRNVKKPFIRDCNKSVYGQFTIEVENRELVQDKLKTYNIPTAVHYPSILPKQPALKNYLIGNNIKKLDIFKHAESASQKVISLPMYPFILESQQEYIVLKLKEILE